MDDSEKRYNIAVKLQRIMTEHIRKLEDVDYVNSDECCDREERLRELAVESHRVNMLYYESAERYASD